MPRLTALTVLVLLAMPPTPDSTAVARTDAPLEFVAEMRGEHVAPQAVETGATGRALGVLVGNRLTVQGSFAGLSSALRDIAKTPDDPGVHLHRGAVGETTPYFFGLRVQLNADERSGIFWGTAELDDDQRGLLLSNRLYIDIHTVQHGPGEIRDQWRPLDPVAATRLRQELADHVPEIASEACHGATATAPEVSA
jgi:hypothetical protein